MARTTVELEILALVDKAQKDVQRFAKDTQGQLSGISFASTVTAISTGFLAIKEAAAPVFSTIKEGFSLAIDEALGAEKALLDLSNALRIQNDFSESAVESFKDFATQLQATTTFSDDAALSALALAKSFKATNSEAKQVVSVAADLAARTGTDLNSAVFAVAQTLNGFVDRSLAKTIPGLKGLSKEALIAGQGISVIGKEVQGSAAIIANSFGGSLQQTKNSFNDLFEAIGEIIIQNPQILEAIKAIKSGFDALTESIKANAGTFGTAISDAFIAFIQAGPAIIQSLRAIDTIVSNIAVGFLALGRTVGAVAAGIQSFRDGERGAGQAIVEALKADVSNDFANNTARIVALYDNLGKAAQVAADQAAKIGKETKATGDAAAKAGKEFENLGKSRSGAGSRLKDAFNADDLKNAAQKARQEIEQIAKDPIKFAIDLSVTKEQKGSLSTLLNDAEKKGVAAATGFLGAVAKGADGAKQLVSGLVGNIADLIVPGLGGPVSEIVGFLSQGPEKVRETVRSFIQAIPEIVKNVVLAIPVLIEELAKAVPQIITAIVDQIPTIVTELVKALPRVAAALAAQMPAVSLALTTGLIRNIPEIVKGFAEEFLKLPERFLDALLDAIPGGGAVGDVVGGVGGFFGDVFGGIGDIFGFAEGGRVPDAPQFRGDRFPARLDAGEQVLSRDLSSQLEDFLSSNQTQPLNVTLQIGEEQFSKVLLNLSRRGFRTGFQRA